MDAFAADDRCVIVLQWTTSPGEQGLRPALCHSLPRTDFEVIEDASIPYDLVCRRPLIDFDSLAVTEGEVTLEEVRRRPDQLFHPRAQDDEAHVFGAHPRPD